MAIRKRKSDLPEYGVKIRLYPTLVQQAKLRQFFGNDRFLWNQLVSLYQERYKNNKKSKLLTEFDLNNLLPAFKNEYPFLKASDSSSFQIVTKNISDAWEAFFAGTRRKPRFHSKHSAKQSYTGKSSRHPDHGQKKHVPAEAEKSQIIENRRHRRQDQALHDQRRCLRALLAFSHRGEKGPPSCQRLARQLALTWG
jgi:transposase